MVTCNRVASTAFTFILLAAYGAGIQVHVEDLAAHVAGRERCDSDARWDELEPAYEDLAAKVG